MLLFIGLSDNAETWKGVQASRTPNTRVATVETLAGQATVGKVCKMSRGSKITSGKELQASKSGFGRNGGGGDGSAERVGRIFRGTSRKKNQESKGDRFHSDRLKGSRGGL